MVVIRNTRNIANQFWQYLFYGLFTSVAITLSEFLDGIVVGNLLGEEGLAIVTLGMPIAIAINIIGMLFGIGPAIAFGNEMGRGEKKTAYSIFTHTLMFTTIVVFLFMGIGLLLYKPLAAWLAVDGGATKLALELFLPYSILSAPLMALLTVICGFLQVDGNPKIAAALFLGANVVNVLMDVVYIKGAGMGAEGSSLGTLTGYGMAMAVLVILLMCKKISLPFLRGEMPQFKVIIHHLPKALPSISTHFLFLFQVLAMNHLASESYGTRGIALISLGLGINSFFFVIISGVTSAMSPMLSVLRGAGDFIGQRFVIVRSFMLLIGVSSVMATFIYFFPNVIFELYSFENNLGREGTVVVQQFALAMVSVAVCVFFSKYYLVISMLRMGMNSSLLRNGLLVFPLMFFLHYMWGITGIAYGYAFANLLTVLFIMCRNSYIAWKSGKVLQGPLLLPTKGEDILFEASIHYTKEEISKLANLVQQNLLAQGETEKTALLFAVAAEELAILTMEAQEIEYKRATMDVLIVSQENRLRLSFNSLGRPFSPTWYVLQNENEEHYNSLWMLTTLADTVEYERILLMNHTSICITDSTKTQHTT